MRASISGIVLAGLWALAPAAAIAAGPFDGVWEGRSVTIHGRCPHRYQARLTIRDGVVRGELVANYERMTVASRVDPSGRMAAIFAHNGRAIMKTTGGRLGAGEGRVEWMSQEPDYFEVADVGTCHGVVTLRRVSDLPRQSELPRQ